MAPGIYIMAGGGFNVSPSTASLTGTGVMIYNAANDVTAGCTTNCAAGPINIGSNPTINLSSSTSGYYQGIVMFQQRDVALQVNLQAGDATTSQIDGVLYAIAANIDLQGGINLHTNIISSSLSAGGNSSITSTPSVPTQIGLQNFGGLSVLQTWKDWTL